MTDDILIERRDGVQTLRFNRPKKKNAITRAMYSALAAGIAAGEADEGIGAHLFLGSGGQGRDHRARRCGLVARPG